MGTSSQIGYLRDMIKCKLFFANNFEQIGLPQSTWLCGKRKNDGNPNEQSEFIVASPFWRGVWSALSGSTQKCTYAILSLIFYNFLGIYILVDTCCHYQFCFALQMRHSCISLEQKQNLPWIDENWCLNWR